jgi:hypothetical protein
MERASKPSARDKFVYIFLCGAILTSIVLWISMAPM